MRLPEGNRIRLVKHEGQLEPRQVAKLSLQTEGFELPLDEGTAYSGCPSCR